MYGDSGDPAEPVCPAVCAEPDSAASSLLPSPPPEKRSTHTHTQLIYITFLLFSGFSFCTAYILHSVSFAHLESSWDYQCVINLPCLAYRALVNVKLMTWYVTTPLFSFQLRTQFVMKLAWP